MLKKFMEIVKDEEGATMVEYALMLALIAVVCIAVVTTLGENARDKFDASAEALAEAED